MHTENESSSVVLEDESAFLEDESEDPILKLNGRLYRYEEKGKQWEERGEGFVTLLKHKESGRVRLLMRQSPSSHVIANHPISPTMKLEEYGGETNSCTWHSTDYEDGQLRDQLFRIQFASAEDWEAFIRRFEDVIETQSKKEENEDTEAAPGFLEKLSVAGSKKPDKQQAREAVSSKEPTSEEEKAEAKAMAN